MSKLDSSDLNPAIDVDELKVTKVSPENISLVYEELFDEKTEGERPCYLPEPDDGDSTVAQKNDGDSVINKETINSNDGIVISENVVSSEVDESDTPKIQNLYIIDDTSFLKEERDQSSEGVTLTNHFEGKEDTADDSSDESNCELRNSLEGIGQFDEPDKLITGRILSEADHRHISMSLEETSENGFAVSPDYSADIPSESNNTLGSVDEITLHEEEENEKLMKNQDSAGQTANFLATNLISGKKHHTEDDGSESWRKHKKHFFILSNAGKPIYSRYGDEHKLAGFSATLQAIISFVDNTGDRIRYIQAGDHQVVFLVKGPIYLVSISSTDEPYEVLRRQLELLHGQLLLILTKSLEKCFVKNANFDLRPLLGGTEAVFSSLIRSFNWNPATFLHSYTCLPLSHTLRQAAGAALQDVADSNVLFALLLADSKVISLVGAQKASLHPDDILLLSNFISSSESFRTSESFSPVCLPHYNATAFLYAYVTYLNTDTCLVFITKNSDAFFHLKACRTKVENFLTEAHVLSEIANSVSKGGLRVEDLPGEFSYGSRSSRISNLSVSSSRHRVGVGSAAGLWHFMYRSVYLDQYVVSEFSPPLHTRESQKRLFHAYERLYASIHGAPAGPHQMQYRRDEHHVLLAWSTADFEFFAAFDPLAEKSSAIIVCNRVCQWIRDVENEIFFVGASPFNCRQHLAQIWHRSLKISAISKVDGKVCWEQ